MRSKIYFIRFGAAGPIKIGYSVNLVNRLAHMKCGHHEEPSILATAPGAAAAEKMLHLMFKDEHMKGEWFAPSERLLAYIAQVETLGRLPEDKVAEQKVELDRLLATAGLDNDLIIFRHHLAACLRKRLFPNTKWTFTAFAKSTGYDIKTIENWTAGRSEPKASTVLRLHKFFSQLGDETFIAELYAIDFASHVKTLKESVTKALA